MLNEHFLSVLVLISDKNYSFYWLAVNMDDAENLGQNELLQWGAIQHLKKNGCSYYDLCYIEKERLPNIYRFKHGFSETEAMIPLISSKTITYKLYNRFRKWF